MAVRTQHIWERFLWAAFCHSACHSQRRQLSVSVVICSNRWSVLIEDTAREPPPPTLSPAQKQPLFPLRSTSGSHGPYTVLFLPCIGVGRWAKWGHAVAGAQRLQTRLPGPPPCHLIARRGFTLCAPHTRLSSIISCNVLLRWALKLFWESGCNLWTL